MIPTIRHNIVFEYNDPNPGQDQYKPHITDDELHIYNHWCESPSGRVSMLSSNTEWIGDDFVRISVHGWRRSGHHGIWATYYFIHQDGKWIQRRRSHSDVKERIPAGMR